MLFNFALSPKEIAEQCAAIIAAQAAEYNAVVAYVQSLSDADRAQQASPTLVFQSTFGRIALADGSAATLSANCTLPSMVSQDPAVRQASSQARSSLQAAFESLKGRRDVFEALSHVLRHHLPPPSALGAPSLSAEDARLVELTMQQFKLNGLDLSPEHQRELKEVKAHLSAKASAFEQRINEDTSGVWFTRDELEGVPESFLSRLKTKPDSAGPLYFVGMKAPELTPLLSSCKREDSRRRAYMCSISRCLENETTLKEMLALRSRVARLLGFDSYPELVFQTKMASDTGSVAQFLLDIAQKLYPTFANDMHALRALKSGHSIPAGGASEATVTPWDVAFLSKQRLDAEFGINDEQIRQYFPLEHVIAATMEIYSQTLSLNFRLVPPGDNRVGHVWHPDVTFYAVSDAGTGELLGHFYLDLFPRDGKYSHQCIYPVSPSMATATSPSAARQLPICALLGNMTKPTAALPSLLQFSEVLTFFHEFGHIVHCVCTQVRHSRLAWAWSVVPWEAGVETDFLEAPSQMLENWLYDSEVLQTLSKHHRTGESLPKSLSDALINSRNLNESVRYERQIFMSLYDLLIHCQDGSGTYSLDIIDTILRPSPVPGQLSAVVTHPVASLPASELEELAKRKGTLSLAEFWSAMQSRFMGYPSFGGTFYPATWYHMTTYAATYYSYLYSSVFSFDMFSLFKTAPRRCFDSALGEKYKRCILRPGASQTGMDMLRQFLGREPSTAAFTEQVVQGSVE